MVTAIGLAVSMIVFGDDKICMPSFVKKRIIAGDCWAAPAATFVRTRGGQGIVMAGNIEWAILVFVAITVLDLGVQSPAIEGALEWEDGVVVKVPFSE